ncbi:MAG: hypothetical protein RL667_122 [Pseudomonadota bacterium]|jgi:hypothetical protein
MVILGFEPTLLAVVGGSVANRMAHRLLHELRVLGFLRLAVL